MDQWAKEIPNPVPGEIDRAFNDLLLIQGCEKKDFRILQMRAYQEHGQHKESWRKIAAAIGGMSHEGVRRRHRDLILSAMEREVKQNAARVAKLGRAA